MLKPKLFSTVLLEALLSVSFGLIVNFNLKISDSGRLGIHPQMDLVRTRAIQGTDRHNHLSSTFMSITKLLHIYIDRGP